MFNNKRQTKDSFYTLLAASLSLPGMLVQAKETGVRADGLEISYHQANYSESDQRMDVDVNQLSILAPIGSYFEFEFNAIKDVTSGASPVLNMSKADGSAQQILEAGASIKDQREVFEGVLTYYADDYILSGKYGFSDEDDYTSNYVSGHLQYFLNDKNTNISAGLSYEEDKVSNVYDPRVFLNNLREFNKRRKINLLFGVEQLIDKNSFVSLHAVYSRASGFLSDPYKKVFVKDQALVFFPSDGIELFLASEFANQNVLGQFVVSVLDSLSIDDLDSVFDFVTESGLGLVISNFLNANPNDSLDIERLLRLGGVYFDSRPEQRDVLAVAASYSRYLERFNAGLHVDYRFAHDEWDADSHTVEFKWKQALGETWLITPSLRYYSQDNAEFYDVYFEQLPADFYLSSDYRLASFGALSAKLEVTKAFGEHFSLGVNYEYYNRKYDWAMDKGVGDQIDDYRFDVWSLNVTYDF